MNARWLPFSILLMPLVAIVGRGAGGGPAPLLKSHTAVQLASSNWSFPFKVTSTTFQNNNEVPQSMVYNGTLGAACSGGNQSPELSWTRPFAQTGSFAVIAFDVTASFAHWGIYNIASSVTELPAGAGTTGTKYGDQITNDAGYAGYSGPCPPPGLTHQYVFTVYALDTKLNLPSSTTFPANAETLFRALLGHVVQSASLTGLYASPPPAASELR